MSTDTILDRLQVCNAEIAGVVRSFRLPPVSPILAGDVPCAISIPRGLTATTPGQSAGQYYVSRTYLVRVLVTPAEAASIDDGSTGAKALTDCVPFLDAVLDYYLQHPQLNTTAGQADLWLVEDMKVTSCEIPAAGIPGPGGAHYFGVEAQLTITERRLDTRLS